MRRPSNEGKRTCWWARDWPTACTACAAWSWWAVGAWRDWRGSSSAGPRSCATGPPFCAATVRPTRCRACGRTGGTRPLPSAPSNTRWSTWTSSPTSPEFFAKPHQKNKKNISKLLVRVGARSSEPPSQTLGKHSFILIFIPTNDRERARLEKHGSWLAGKPGYRLN